jgi:hypothetical protein
MREDDEDGLPDDWLDFYRLGRHPDRLRFIGSFELNDITDGNPELVAHLWSIARRAQAAGLHVALSPSPLVLGIVFPAGSRQRPLFIDHGWAACVDDTLFEQYAYLAEYDGIWSETASTVEVRVKYSAADPSPALQHIGEQKIEPGNLWRLAPIDVASRNGIEIAFGRPTDAAAAMLAIDETSDLDSFSLRITGVRLTTETDAREILASVGSAFLLDVDDIFPGLPWFVRSPDKEGTEEVSFRSPKRMSGLTDLSFPDRTPRPEPLARYVYARRLSEGSYVHRYVAFYHVIEFLLSHVFAHARHGRCTRGLV